MSSSGSIVLRGLEAEILEGRKAKRELVRLMRVIEQAPCPWSACCLDGDNVHSHYRGKRCWKAKALVVEEKSE